MTLTHARERQRSPHEHTHTPEPRRPSSEDLRTIRVVELSSPSHRRASSVQWNIFGDALVLTRDPGVTPLVPGSPRCSRITSLLPGSLRCFPDHPVAPGSLRWSPDHSVASRITPLLPGSPRCSRITPLLPGSLHCSPDHSIGPRIAGHTRVDREGGSLLEALSAPDANCIGLHRGRAARRTLASSQARRGRSFV